MFCLFLVAILYRFHCTLLFHGMEFDVSRSTETDCKQTANTQLQVHVISVSYHGAS